MPDRDRLIELIEGWYANSTTEYLADYLLANGVFILPEDLRGTDDFSISAFIEAMQMYKEKDRYIKSPCKVGDKIYRIAKDSKTIIEEQIGNANVEFVIDNGTGIQGVWWLKDYNIGKTVFLTKEEAEEKLREKSGKDVNL